MIATKLLLVVVVCSGKLVTSRTEELWVGGLGGAAAAALWGKGCLSLQGKQLQLEGEKNWLGPRGSHIFV